MTDTLTDDRVLKNDTLPRLEKWLVMQGHLLGYVYNHPGYVDGTLIRTSKIIFIADEMVITKNQPYVLGNTGRNLPELSRSVS